MLRHNGDKHNAADVVMTMLMFILMYLCLTFLMGCATFKQYEMVTYNGKIYRVQHATRKQVDIVNTDGLSIHLKPTSVKKY